jgi:hypothetical protein
MAHTENLPTQLSSIHFEAFAHQEVLFLLQFLREPLRSWTRHFWLITPEWNSIWNKGKIHKISQMSEAIKTYEVYYNDTQGNWHFQMHAM